MLELIALIVLILSLLFFQYCLKMRGSGSTGLVPNQPNINGNENVQYNVGLLYPTGQARVSILYYRYKGDYFIKVGGTTTNSPNKILSKDSEISGNHTFIKPGLIKGKSYLIYGTLGGSGIDPEREMQEVFNIVFGGLYDYAFSDKTIKDSRYPNNITRPKRWNTTGENFRLKHQFVDILNFMILLNTVEVRWVNSIKKKGVGDFSFISSVL